METRALTDDECAKEENSPFKLDSFEIVDDKARPSVSAKRVVRQHVVDDTIEHPAFGKTDVEHFGYFPRVSLLVHNLRAVVLRQRGCYLSGFIDDALHKAEIEISKI